MYVYIYTHIYTHIYMYVYIYIVREAGRHTGAPVLPASQGEGTYTYIVYIIDR